MQSNKKERKPNQGLAFAGLMIVAFGLAILLFGGQGDTPPANENGVNFCDNLEEKPLFRYTIKFTGTTIYYYNESESENKFYIYTTFANGSYSIEDTTTGYAKSSMGWQTLYDFHLDDAKEKELVSSQGYCWLRRMIWWIEVW